MSKAFDEFVVARCEESKEKNEEYLKAESDADKAYALLKSSLNKKQLNLFLEFESKSVFLQSLAEILSYNQDR